MTASSSRLVLVIAVLLWAGCGTPRREPVQDTTLVGREPASVVGIARRDFVDERRASWTGAGPRPLATTILYPAASGSPLVDLLDGQSLPFVVPVMSPAAEMASPAHPRPLILLSHGTGGSAMQLLWLGHHLAAGGAIVALVDHHGNTAAEPALTPEGMLLFWERASDLSALLDALLADATFGPRIDRARIGAAGFSLGGYTVLALAGARFSPEQFERFCRSPGRDRTCEPQAELPDALERFAERARTDPAVGASLRRASDSHRDARIKAVFAIAPALGSGLDPASLAGIAVPVGLLVGDGDQTCPAATNAARVAALVPGARLTIVPGGVGHYTFLADCTPAGQAHVELCRDAPGVDRATVHRDAAALVARFFASSL